MGRTEKQREFVSVSVARSSVRVDKLSSVPLVDDLSSRSLDLHLRDRLREPPGLDLGLVELVQLGGRSTSRFRDDEPRSDGERSTDADWKRTEHWSTLS